MADFVQRWYAAAPGSPDMLGSRPCPCASSSCADCLSRACRGRLGNAKAAPLAVHPYYPAELHLPGYVAPQLPFEQVLAVFFVCSSALFVGVWWLSGSEMLPSSLIWQTRRQGIGSTEDAVALARLIQTPDRCPTGNVVLVHRHRRDTLHHRRFERRCGPKPCCRPVALRRPQRSSCVALTPLVRCCRHPGAFVLMPEFYKDASGHIFAEICA